MFLRDLSFLRDLDFSLLPDAAYSAEEIGRQLAEVARDVTSLSGIEFAGVPRIESMRNKQAEPTFRARIEYRGPLSMPNHPKVLVDITRFERVEDDAAQRPILHPYPDDLPSGILVSTYSLEELFAEKTRALYERTRPRDLYDVVQLTDNFADRIDFQEARALFGLKCSAKGLTAPSGPQLSAMVIGSAELAADWENMLGHQLPALPPLVPVLARIAGLLGWLDEAGAATDADKTVTEAPRRPAPASKPLRPSHLQPVISRPGEALVAPPGMTYWGTGRMDLIRFAGANRLMVEFAYSGRPRTVEPYVLRQPGTGNLLLYAWEPESGQIKAFKIAEMIGLRVSRKPFAPRFAIQLTGVVKTSPRSGPSRSPGRRNR